MLQTVSASMWRLVLNVLKEHSKPSEGTLKIDEVAWSLYLPLCFTFLSTWSLFTVHSYSQAPDYQRSNPYIHTGYRAPQVSGTSIDLNSTKISHPQTWSQCARSVLQFHNETLNIWTHLLGAFAFLALLLWYSMQDCFEVITWLNLHIKFYSLAIRFHLLDVFCFYWEFSRCKKVFTQSTSESKWK